MALAPTCPIPTSDSGERIPSIGFGTYPLRGDDAVTAISGAVDAGYRLLDTAVNYRNEREVAQAVRASKHPRDAVWIQTKVPGRDHGDAKASIETSLEVMDLEYLDSVLIHWPNPSRDLYLTAWEGLIEAQGAGLVRHIGVSNFTEQHLTRIIEATGVTPFANQIELHPLFPQAEMRAVHERLGIITQAWSPMGKASAPFAAASVRDAAAAHDCTPGQAILAWHVGIGSLPLPKSATASRQVENLAAAEIVLTAAEIEAISALAQPDGRLFDGDPDHHEEL